MRCTKVWILGTTLCGALLCASNSQAGSITYLAVGTFTSSGTPTFTSPDLSTSVAYSSLESTATVPPANNVSLGTFMTASTSSPTTPTMVTDTFTLVVFNTTPGSPDFGNSITFTATMSGTISSSTSSADMQFNTPLSANLDGYTFTIVNADQGISGRINLNAPTTNGGISTIDAIVTATVPEPGSVVLLGLALPALAGLAYRRTRR